MGFLLFSQIYFNFHIIIITHSSYSKSIFQNMIYGTVMSQYFT